MGIELIDHKLILKFLNDLMVINRLILCLFDEYFLELIGLELKVLPIEEILTKVIQPQLMKGIPLGPTDVIILTMIKVIVVELENDERRQVDFGEGFERYDIILFNVNLFKEGTVEPWELFYTEKVAFIDDYFGEMGEIDRCEVG
jgi:hypothetical protein